MYVCVESPVKKMKSDEVGDWKDGESDASVTDGTVDTAAGTSATAASTGTAGDGAELGDCGKGYECQYCGRGYRTVNVLIAHELQHLIGNHIEVCFLSLCGLLGCCLITHRLYLLVLPVLVCCTL